MIEAKNTRKGKVDILKAQCYIKNEEIYINMVFDVEKDGYLIGKNIVVKLISSNGNTCATLSLCYAWDLFPNGESSCDEKIVSWNDFYKLEPDTYQVVISLS